MSMDVLKMLNICTKDRCGECEFNEIRKSSISGFVFCMEKLMNEAADEIRRLREELNESRSISDPTHATEYVLDVEGETK